MSALFQPFQLKGVTLRNRIGVAPMCQYSARDGIANDWHLFNYAAQARGGAGLVVIEATGVSPEGRITPDCTGIWSDAHAEAFAPIVRAIKSFGAVPGIQLGHAGRKASANNPWEGDDHIPTEDPRGWETIAPSAIPFGGQLSKVPREMTLADITRVRDDFVAAAKRARAAGFEWLELHFAHGYLAQTFFSKEANQRTDSYGGSFENRSRFLRETFAAVRAVWPEEYPLTVRFGVTEFNGRVDEDLAESVALARNLKADGMDLLDTSIGFSTPENTIPWSMGFMGPIARRIRTEAGIPVASAWNFGEPNVAEAAVAKGELDVVLVGKAHLANPHWAYEAARTLKIEELSSVLPPPYGHWLGRY